MYVSRPRESFFSSISTQFIKLLYPTAHTSFHKEMETFRITLLVVFYSCIEYFSINTFVIYFYMLIKARQIFESIVVIKIHYTV